MIYTRFCFCKNSRRLLEASMAKTVSNETSRIDMINSIAPIIHPDQENRLKN